MVTAWFKRSSRFKLLAAIMTVALMLTLAVKVSAQVSTPSSSTSLSSKLENAFSAPRGPGSPMPDNRDSGATRGDQCVPGDQRLPVALVPPPSKSGQTASEHPSVFWYMPRTNAKAIEFVLRDANVNDVYRVWYSLPKTTTGVVSPAGIKSLTIANPYPLEIGQEYHWQLALICDPSDTGKDYIVEGFIKRVAPEPTLVRRVQQATPEDRIALYADAQLWYETLATLVELRRDRPNDSNLQEAWNKLLEVVGLQAIAQKTANAKS